MAKIDDLYLYGTDVLSKPPAPIPSNSLTPGSIVRRRVMTFRPAWHYGVVRDYDSLVHVGKGGARELTLRYDDFTGFAAGDNVYVEHLAPLGIDTWELDRRAEQLTANGALYDLFRENCEHAAMYIATGEKRSTQVENALKLLGFMAVGAIAVHLANKK